MINSLFLGIGAQKAGTTWLHRILSRDSRLAFPPFIKEVHYFSAIDHGDKLLNLWRAGTIKRLANRDDFQATLARYLSSCSGGAKLSANDSRSEGVGDLFYKLKICLDPISDSWYESLFNTRGENSAPCVDITPAYAQLSVAGFSHLNSVADRLSVLFILRDPVERSWSGLLQGVKTGRDKSVSLAELSGLSTDRLVSLLLRPSVKKASDYLNTFRNVQGAQLLHKMNVAFYDDVKSSPSQVLEIVYKCLGMSAIQVSPEQLSEVVYKSPDAKMPSEVAERLLEVFRADLKVLQNHYCDLPVAWKSKYSL